MATNFETFSNLEKFFSERTKYLTICQEPTKAYITNVFTKCAKNDLSKEILTLVFAKAKMENKYELFQSLGDWILFAKSMYPESLRYASSEYYNALAQISYLRCYRILDKKWVLFEELADQFPKVVDKLQTLFKSPEKTEAYVSPYFLTRI